MSHGERPGNPAGKNDARGGRQADDPGRRIAQEQAHAKAIENVAKSSRAWSDARSGGASGKEDSDKPGSAKSGDRRAPDVKERPNPFKRLMPDKAEGNANAGGQRADGIGFKSDYHAAESHRDAGADKSPSTREPSFFKRLNEPNPSRDTAGGDSILRRPTDLFGGGRNHPDQSATPRTEQAHRTDIGSAASHAAGDTARENARSMLSRESRGAAPSPTDGAVNRTLPLADQRPAGQAGDSLFVRSTAADARTRAVPTDQSSAAAAARSDRGNRPAATDASSQKPAENPTVGSDRAKRDQSSDAANLTAGERATREQLSARQDMAPSPFGKASVAEGSVERVMSQLPDNDRLMAKNGEGTLRLHGYASNPGDANFNMDLSRRRTEPVVDTIRLLGYTCDIEVVPHGETDANAAATDGGKPSETDQITQQRDGSPAGRRDNPDFRGVRIEYVPPTVFEGDVIEGVHPARAAFDAFDKTRAAGETVWNQLKVSGEVVRQDAAQLENPFILDLGDFKDAASVAKDTAGQVKEIMAKEAWEKATGEVTEKAVSEALKSGIKATVKDFVGGPAGAIVKGLARPFAASTTEGVIATRAKEMTQTRAPLIEAVAHGIASVFDENFAPMTSFRSGAEQRAYESGRQHALRLTPEQRTQASFYLIDETRRGNLNAPERTKDFNQFAKRLDGSSIKSAAVNAFKADKHFHWK